ncbi:Mini-chromosome maintenance 7 [Carpediemonas membranifera]|uniref:DNA replication licensing factor MCM7 n=1 Tax=Carpediemonas membranifera TaxID=201153 RepID=A0A8J6BAW1_9EUKA|nr:Mini-chromosome maintenance 7 [Carpediemonas membranifera]|eukprot:KAG9396422.1 Mini-chromosome maintenance 7 [Carpediemonas membranifera]
MSARPGKNALPRESHEEDLVLALLSESRRDDRLFVTDFRGNTGSELQGTVFIKLDDLDRIVEAIESKPMNMKDDDDRILSTNRSLHDLVRRIESNVERYSRIFAQVIHEKIVGLPPQARPEFAEQTRRFQVRFVTREASSVTPIINVRSSRIGQLIKVRGVVTHATQSVPKARVICYQCSNCTKSIYEIVERQDHQPLESCDSAECIRAKKSGTLTMNTSESLFVPAQHIRIQQLSAEVKQGNVPISITVHMVGEGITRSCNPGDIVTLEGVYIPILYEGGRQFQRGLLNDTAILAHRVVKEKTQLLHAEVDAANIAMKLKHKGSVEAFKMLSSSIAPKIIGHENVKKALLLQLIGGVERTRSDRTVIRGDLNVCLMGDPGCGKSQILKYVAQIAPRGVYTSGKSSSGVGLTAAVVRDPMTRQFTLEGGALVLADQGVCCIDEFDKMDDGDRGSIYEAMEQQRVSVAKGGLVTTLNARASIVAAANPAWGKYDVTKSTAENINLPPAMLSRFDLLFLIIDDQGEEETMDLARAILSGAVDDSYKKSTLSLEEMRHFLRIAKLFKPHMDWGTGAALPAEAARIRDYYLACKADDVEQNDYKDVFTSYRMLQSLSRLAMAHAKLRMTLKYFSDPENETLPEPEDEQTSATVSKTDVEEAIRLMKVSRESFTRTKKRRSGRTIASPDEVKQMIVRILEDNGSMKRDELIKLTCSRLRGAKADKVSALIKSWAIGGALEKRGEDISLPDEDEEM